MYAVRLLVSVNSKNKDTKKSFESILYKDIKLPFLPFFGLRINSNNSTSSPPIKSIAWNADTNFFECQCESGNFEEPLGSDEKYQWHHSYVTQEFVAKGWQKLDLEEDI